ncbi:hypothetical protein [Parabacteroides sp. PF5-9]|uniref:hypothetical protein n=1 Tax=Parabacteroides sp. PF5-9 TaxID=1742404 RepID=UPI0024766AD8|nr:hypothetical protein [Parabacteroides sp. PF5-9]MDH6357219.1 hypothetical protein [Parabacteroides sp. PF5-9]
MSNITFEYAINFEENESRFDAVKASLGESVLFFSQNTPLQFFCCDLMCELMDLHTAILKGERGDYVYNSALSKIEEFKAVKAEYLKSDVVEKMQSLSKEITRKKIGENGRK